MAGAAVANGLGVGAPAAQALLVLAGLCMTFHLLVLDVRSLWRLLRFLGTLLRVLSVFGMDALRGSGGVRVETHERAARLLADQLVQLGGLWAKVGQYAAMRGDLLPATYAREFKRCQDGLPAEPWPVVRLNIQRELGGRDIDEVFEWIDKKPVASATIAQVHKALLRGPGPASERLVAVKVAHTGVRRKVMSDLRILWLLTSQPLRHRSVTVLRALRVYLNEVPGELNFVHEAVNMDRIRSSLLPRRRLRPAYLVPFTRPLREWDYDALDARERAGQRTCVRIKFNSSERGGMFVPAELRRRLPQRGEHIFEVSLHGDEHCMERDADDICLEGDHLFIDVDIPKVYHQFVSVGMLVMSFEEGVSPKRADVLSCGENMANQILMIARAFSHMSLVSHFSHGDPHAANVLLRTRGVRPCIIDFGFCAQVDPRHSHAWSSVVLAAQQMQPESVGKSLVALGFKPDPSLAPLSTHEQALLMSRRLIESQMVGIKTGEDIRLRLSNLEQLARHNLIQLDFLFLLRILNYIRNLFGYVNRVDDFIPTYTAYAALAIGAIENDSPPPPDFDRAARQHERENVMRKI